MKKNITIVDFKGNKKTISINNFENVVSIYVTILSGDEVLEVLYKNGRTKTFDSSDYRIMNYYCGGYFLNLSKIDEFSKMNNSYEKQRGVRLFRGKK